MMKNNSQVKREHQLQKRNQVALDVPGFHVAGRSRTAFAHTKQTWKQPIVHWAMLLCR